MSRVSVRPYLLVCLLLLLLSCSIPTTSVATPLPTATKTPTPTQTPSPIPPTQTSTPIPLAKVKPPPPGMLYHGVYPGGTTGEESDLTLADLHSYEELVGKRAAWVYFSHNWYEGRAFPSDTATWVREAGSIPYIRMMLRSRPKQRIAEPLFHPQNIVEGRFDADLHTWCASARDFGTPMLVEYGVEVNGEWFSWNGVWNGGGMLDGYGNPTQPDGPERFRDAYRHIIRICRDEGAENLTWVFHINAGDNPEVEWNRFENYYPGDEWIDWIGISHYASQGPQTNYWEEFRDAMDPIYTRLDALTSDKPIIVAEFAAPKNNPLGDQANWAHSALTDMLSLRWPRLIGFAWWNEWWQNDDDPTHDTTMRVQDNPALAKIFMELLSENENVLERVLP